MNTIITSEYAQSLSSLKLGSILRDANSNANATSYSLLQHAVNELKARNSYESELSRRIPS